MVCGFIRPGKAQGKYRRQTKNEKYKTYVHNKKCMYNKEAPQNIVYHKKEQNNKAKENNPRFASPVLYGNDYGVNHPKTYYYKCGVYK
jgi:hypothetical protein